MIGAAFPPLRPTLVSLLALSAVACASNETATTEVEPDVASVVVDIVMDIATEPDVAADVEAPDLASPDVPDAGPVAPDVEPFCRVTGLPGDLHWCPVRLVRATDDTPPAVGLDLVLQYPDDRLSFLGVASFPCGDPSCAPEFVPPYTLTSGHAVAIAPTVASAWAGAGSVSVHSAESLSAISSALPGEPEAPPVLWLGFQPMDASADTASSADVDILSAAATAPPGGVLTAKPAPGAIQLEGTWQGPKPDCIAHTATGACDDGLVCTTDRCNAGGVCEHALLGGYCVIGNTCLVAGTLNPENSCEVCEPTQFNDAWSSRQGEPCDDGDACTTNTLCVKSNCEGEALACNDKNPCTTDSCVSPLGCRFDPDPTCGEDDCDQDPTAPECQCVVARARSLECGGVVVWGDEHVAFQIYQDSTGPYWEQLFGWMKAAGNCGTERTTIAFLSTWNPAMVTAAQAVGLTVVNEYGVPPPTADIAIVSAGGSFDPVALKTWIEAGGVIMFTIVGNGAGTAECAGPNSYLKPLGYTLECSLTPPWGPIATPSTHPIMTGLTAENVPFVNGRWVLAEPGAPKGVVARVPADVCPPP